MRWRCDKTGAAIHTWFCADPVSRKGDGTFSESVCCRGSDVVEDTKGHGCSDSLYECCGFSKDSSGSQKNKDESQNREKIWIALLFLAQQKKEGFFSGYGIVPAADLSAFAADLEHPCGGKHHLQHPDDPCLSGRK